MRGKKERILRSKATLWDFWNNIKDANICTIGVPEAEEREEPENYLKK